MTEKQVLIEEIKAQVMFLSMDSELKEDWEERLNLITENAHIGAIKGLRDQYAKMIEDKINAIRIKFFRGMKPGGEKVVLIREKINYN